MEGLPVTEVPREPFADSMLGWVQPLVALWLTVASVVSMHPYGYSGLGAYALVLLVLCALQGISRSLPDRLVGPRSRLAAAVVASVLCGLLYGVASNTWAAGWAYVVTAHVGFRFPPRLAIGLAAVTAAVAVVALGAGPHLDDAPWVWWTGLTVALPVVTGIARQNRARTLATARELVAQTRRAAASETEASALAERNRIARDLHDVLAHSLSGVSVQLDTADALIEAGRYDEGRAALQAARGLTVEGLVQAREAVTTLREDAVDLPDALARCVQGAERLVVTGATADVPSPVARAVVRIVQEALTNARRHAPGAPALVEVAVDSSVRVVVTTAAPPHAARPFDLGGGRGLAGMRERVEPLAGTFAAGPHAGGWRVAVELPLVVAS